MRHSPSSDDILRTMQAVMKEMFDLDPAKVHADARLVEDLDLDSIDAIDLALKLEEVTGLVFDETRLRQMRTIRDIIAAIQVDVAEVGRGKLIPA
jgi:acyl carrier protein